MISPGSATRIFLAAGPTDMRRGFDGLSEMVRSRLGQEALSGHWFLFCNRRRTRIKVLYFDGTGLWICSKRLGRGTYSWPDADAGPVITLSAEELSMLVGGIDLERASRRNWWRKTI